MRWSWKLGRVAGIDLYIHATFLLVFLFVPGLSEGREDVGAVQPLLRAAESVMLIMAVFGCVVLHEFGHALMARRFGIETADITLYPIGGVARLRRMPRAPGAELLIALAGPAVNFAIVAAMLLLAWIGVIHLALDSFLLSLLVINVLLAVFNLVPAFPMDGGRVLRALLSAFLGRARATSVAAAVGRVMAVLFGLAAIFWTHNPLHLALAAFIVLAGRAEESRVLYEEGRRRGLDPGIWVAPPGYRWVQRGDGIWQLAPALVRMPEPGTYQSPWR
jgi:Zn-dependent protease